MVAFCKDASALFSAFLICLYFGCPQTYAARTITRGRNGRSSTTTSTTVANSIEEELASDNSISNDNISLEAAAEAAQVSESEAVVESLDEDSVADPPTSSLFATQQNAASIVNSDLVDKMSWNCANNASCLYKLVSGIVQSYRRGETVKLGFIDLVKIPPTGTTRKSSSNRNHNNLSNGSSGKRNKFNFDAKSETGRSMSTFVDFIRGNAIRVPVGPMVFSVQRAEDDDDYIEVALLKKASSQGRRGGDDEGGGGAGGILGAVVGGGGGGGGDRHGIGDRIHERRQQHQDKKQFQMLIPMYLAATTFGWTMVAAKAVGLLTIKALIISKLAFVVAAMIIVKKLMDNASEKMMYQFPEHSPYMMPYSMDYPAMHALGPEISTNDMYPALQLAAAPLPHHPGHPIAESFTAESHLHHNIADVHNNNTQVLAALNAVGLGQKVKREDSWIAKTTAARRPIVYNYLQTHHPFYRAR